MPIKGLKPLNVHSRVRAKTKDETEGTGRYIIRPLLSLKRLFLDEKEGEVWEYSNFIIIVQC
jgi:hypothetical protein